MLASFGFEQTADSEKYPPLTTTTSESQSRARDYKKQSLGFLGNTSIQVQDVCREVALGSRRVRFFSALGEVGSRKIRAEKKASEWPSPNRAGKAPRKEKNSLSPRVNSGMLTGWGEEGKCCTQGSGSIQGKQRGIRVKASHTSWKGAYKVKGLH